jgi:hypothetical protein
MFFNKIIFYNSSFLNYKNLFYKKNISVINYNLIPFHLEYKKKLKINKNQNLNIFEQINVSEPEHSVILANLLNPVGSHGYGYLFLKLFFETFYTELTFSEKEHWIVTAEKERYDIRIRNIDNSKIIIIENKSNNAQDQENQLYRYWFNGIYSAQYNRKRLGLGCFSKIIYLSPSDYKQPDRQTLSRPKDMDINFPETVPIEMVDIRFFNKHIVKWLDKCLNSIDSNTNVYYYLKQYFDFWGQLCFTKC